MPCSIGCYTALNPAGSKKSTRTRQTPCNNAWHKIDLFLAFNVSSARLALETSHFLSNVEPTLPFSVGGENSKVRTVWNTQLVAYWWCHIPLNLLVLQGLGLNLLHIDLYQFENVRNIV